MGKSTLSLPPPRTFCQERYALILGKPAPDRFSISKISLSEELLQINEQKPNKLCPLVTCHKSPMGACRSTPPSPSQTTHQNASHPPIEIKNAGHPCRSAFAEPQREPAVLFNGLLNWKLFALRADFRECQHQN